jgi:hypothetical protein
VTFIQIVMTSISQISRVRKVLHRSPLLCSVLLKHVSVAGHMYIEIGLH